MIIRVTQAHIANGKKCNINYCPIALAIMDEGFSYAKVTDVDFFADNANNDDSGRIWGPLPLEATKFVERFDAGLAVEPFEFELYVLYT